MYFYARTQHKGFTLIELLVVVAIIGVLASVVLASLNQARSKARDTKRVAEMNQLKSALEAYYLDNGAYPNSSWICSYQSGWQTGTLATNLADYIPNLPIDPVNEDAGRSYQGYLNYCYFGTSYTGGGAANQWYMLVYRIENQDTALDTTQSLDCAGNNRNYGGVDGHIIMLAGDCVQ